MFLVSFLEAMSSCTAKVDGRVQCYSLKGLKAETHTCYIASLCGGIIWTSWIILLAAMQM